MAHNLSMENKLSDKLERWSKTDSTPTLIEFNKEFSEEGMALLILILIAPSALPVPTGGITHIFQVLVLIVAMQILMARKYLWIPKKMYGIKLDGKFKTLVMPKLIKFIKKIEPSHRATKFKPQNIGKLDAASALMIIAFTLGAFFAPPFSMLDTLPSMAVIFIALSLISKAKRPFIIGTLIGVLGLVLEIFFSAAVIEFAKRLSSSIF